ncbi:hypothetical protein [Azospirillum palustre]
MDPINTTAAESPADYGPGSAGECARWLSEIRLAEKEFEKWWEKAGKIVDRYKDERDGQSKNKHRMNLLWSNVQTLAPALYAAAPKPEIERRYKDNDPLGRAASQVLERCTAYSIQTHQDFDAVARAALLDYLLVGRGTTWERYVPHFREVKPRIPLTKVEPASIADDGVQIGGENEVEPDDADDLGQPAGKGSLMGRPIGGAKAMPGMGGQPMAAPAPAAPAQPQPGYVGPSGQPVDPSTVMMDDDGQPYAEGEPFEEIEYEEVVTDYVHWRDFLYNAARVWGEVRWVARRVYMTRTELVERFGKEIGSKVSLDFTPSNVPLTARDHGPEFQAYKKATVFEIWDKGTKSVIWIARDCKDYVLDKRKDPLGLTGFFPCPKPIFGTLANDSLVPVPDFIQYQDQANEVDELSERISLLVKALKVAGVYNAEAEGVQRLLQSGVENKLIPVDSWAAFASIGGMRGNIEWLPIEQIAGVLQQLYAARKAVKDEIYEVTGLADIIRGQGVASETATAQRIKGQFASLRLKDRQSEVARFCRDIVRIKSEIIAEHFSDETIALASGADLMGPDGQQLPQVLAMFRDDGIRNFRLDVETDSTIAADEQADKQAVTEFLGAVGQFMTQALPTGQQFPELIPMFGEMLMFGARRYRVGRGLESTIEQGIGSLAQKAQAAAQQPPKPDPKVQAEQQKLEMQAQAQQQKTQGDLAAQQARAQADIAIGQAKAQGEMQIDKLKAQHKMQLDEMQAQHQAQLDEHKAQMEMAAKMQPGPWWTEPLPPQQ